VDAAAGGGVPGIDENESDGPVMIVWFRFGMAKSERVGRADKLAPIASLSRGRRHQLRHPGVRTIAGFPPGAVGGWLMEVVNRAR
jgi:hypothetical protein